MEKWAKSENHRIASESGIADILVKTTIYPCIIIKYQLFSQQPTNRNTGKS